MQIIIKSIGAQIVGTIFKSRTFTQSCCESLGTGSRNMAVRNYNRHLQTDFPSFVVSHNISKPCVIMNSLIESKVEPMY